MILWARIRHLGGISQLQRPGRFYRQKRPRFTDCPRLMGLRRWREPLAQAQLQDSSGGKHAVDLTSTSGFSWKGWKYVKFNVPSTIKAPLKVNQIYITELKIRIKQRHRVLRQAVGILYGFPGVRTRHWRADAHGRWRNGETPSICNL